MGWRECVSTRSAIFRLNAQIASDRIRDQAKPERLRPNLFASPEHTGGGEVRMHSEDQMNSVIYLIGLVVVVLAILSFLGMG